MEGKNKITSFKDLVAWSEWHKLVLSIYKITEAFPKSEAFGLTMQLRRAIVSVTSNIAEGFSRVSSKDKAYCYIIALGSLTEVQNQIEIARDVSFIVEVVYAELYKQTIIIHKLINGLIKSTKNCAYEDKAI
jgi:four helix bundle protein